MGYPAVADVQAWATSNNVDQAPVFAFASQHARLPANAGEEAGYEQSVNAENAGLVNNSSSVVFLYAYIEANKGFPPNTSTFQQWLINQGYMTPSLGLTGVYPVAGSYYAAATGAAGSSAPAPAVNPQPTGIDVNSLLQHPLLLAGGALAAVVAIKVALK